jgi:uncharacterized damage-inducible protein DinB
MITLTPWVERKFDFNYPVGLFPIIVERLRATLPALKSMIVDVDENKLSEKKEDKWSVKEVIGHLSDLEELWKGRIDDFLSGKETLRAADMSNTKTHDGHHNEKRAEKLFNQFSDSRNQLINQVKNFDENTATLTALHPRLQKPMRLVDSLFFVAEHDDHELTKIRNLLG